MAQKQIAAVFSELTLQETTEPKGLHVPQDSNDPRGLKVGVLTPVCFILADGTEYQVDSTEGQLGVTVVKGSKQVKTYYNVAAFAAGTENEFWDKIDNDVERYCEKE